MRAPVVLDTNVVSELMRAESAPDVLRWLTSLPAERVCTTAVTLAEVGVGIARLPKGRRRDLLAAAADAVFGAYGDRVLAFDVPAARHHGDIVSAREARGMPISALDAQIAAICRSHGAILATRNTRDFVHLDLVIVDPWAGP